MSKPKEAKQPVRQTDSESLVLDLSRQKTGVDVKAPKPKLVDMDIDSAPSKEPKTIVLDNDEKEKSENVMHAAKRSTQTGGKKRMDDVTFSPKLVGPIEELRAMDLVNFHRLDKSPNVAAKKINDKVKLLEEEDYGKRLSKTPEINLKKLILILPLIAVLTIHFSYYIDSIFIVIGGLIMMGIVMISVLFDQRYDEAFENGLKIIALGKWYREFIPYNDICFICNYNVTNLENKL